MNSTEERVQAYLRRLEGAVINDVTVKVDDNEHITQVLIQTGGGKCLMITAAELNLVFNAPVLS